LQMIIIIVIILKLLRRILLGSKLIGSEVGG